MNRIARALIFPLLALTLLAAPGCGESPVENLTQPNGTGQNSGGTNTFIVDGDGYSSARFASNGHFGMVFDGSTSITISAIYDGQPATLAISLRSAGTGTYQLEGYNLLSMTIRKGFDRAYNSVNGSVTITDIGSESGTIRGSFTASVLRYDTGAPATVQGSFAVDRR